MFLDNLVLEVTRRCNMACEHCCRGDAQNLDMRASVIDRALLGVRYISQLTFSGGEPSLNVPAIEHTIRVLERDKIGINGFYVATNGKEPSIRLAMALLKLYSMSDEPDMCMLGWSNDQWHLDHCIKEPVLYKGLGFYHPRESKEDRERWSRTINIADTLINEGRARENGLSSRGDKMIETLTVNKEYKDEFRVESTIYVSANGNVMTDGDCSFERIDSENIGNVLGLGLQTIINRAWTKQQMAKEEVAA